VTTSAQVVVERHGEAVVARLTGEVDMTNAGYVGDELRESVPNDAAALVVDLSETGYIDSAAIGLLFELARRLTRRRQDLRLVVPEGSPLQRVLEITEIQTAAPIHQSVDSALAAD
jgi:anti-sigma B factor antagonist